VLYSTPTTATSGSEPPSDSTAATPSVTQQRLFQYIAVAYRDGSVKLIDKQTFQPMTTTNLDTGISDVDNNTKRRRTIAYMTSMHQTVTGASCRLSLCLTLLDTSLWINLSGYLSLDTSFGYLSLDASLSISIATNLNYWKA